MRPNPAHVFRGGAGQLRGLFVVSLCLVLAGAVTVFGSAKTLQDLTRSLAEVVREEAGRSARLACAEVAQAANSLPGSTLEEIAGSPLLQHTLRTLSPNYDVVLASLVSPEGETVTHYYCEETLGRMSKEKAAAIKSPACLQAATLDGIPEGLLPEEVVPVQEELWRDGELLGFVRVFGLSDVMTARRVEPLRARISAILAFMVLLVLGILLLAVALIYWTLQRQADLLRRTAAAEQLADLGSLAGGLSHEMRNPMQCMNLHLDLAREELEEAEEARDPAALDRAALSSTLGRVQDQMRRLAMIVENFTTMARGQSRTTEPVDIVSAIRVILERQRDSCRRAGIAITAENLPESMVYETDPAALEQAIENLILRSQEELRGRGGGRRITLSHGEDHGWHRLVIEDNGPGLTEEEARTIFHPFVSSGDLGRRCLALTLARRMIEGCGGTLDAFPGHEEGARFVISFPARRVKYTPARQQAISGAPM